MSYLTNQILRGVETIRRNSRESNKNSDSAFNKNMTTDTPRTDALIMECPSHLQEVALANLAIDLERELAASLKNQLKTECDLLQSQDINWFLDTEFRIACKRAEKAEAEVERLRHLLIESSYRINEPDFVREIEETLNQNNK